MHISPGEGTEVSTLFRGDQVGVFTKESARAANSKCLTHSYFLQSVSTFAECFR